MIAIGNSSATGVASIDLRGRCHDRGRTSRQVAVLAGGGRDDLRRRPDRRRRIDHDVCRSASRAHRDIPRLCRALEDVQDDRFTPAATLSQVISDDGVRVWMDGAMILDEWAPHESKVSRVRDRRQRQAPLQGRVLRRHWFCRTPFRHTEEMMDWITDPQIWIALATLTFLEIVLGVDNIIFISILSGKLPPTSSRGPAARPARRDGHARACCCSRSPGSSG